MNKKIVIITHKNCPDGFCAAWVAWTKFKNTALYIGERPGQTNLKYFNKLKDKDVYIFDISIPHSLISDLKTIVNKLVIIDHHPDSSNLIDSKEPNLIYDDKYSAAYLCWKFFYPKKKVPEFIKLISDNDTGTWKMKNSKELTSFVRYNVKTILKPSNFSKISKLLTPSFLKLGVQIGSYYAEYENQLIATIVRSATYKQWGKYKIMIINANIPTIGGKIATKLSEQPDVEIGIVYRKLDDTNTLFTMRSNKKHIDLNKIAKKFGGGGHLGAASFITSKNIVFK